MGDLTKNISQKELVCNCKNPECTATISPGDKVIGMVQSACDHFADEYHVPKVICLITSGARCAEHNAKEGGKPKSLHLAGKAIDFKLKLPNGEFIEPKAIYDYLELVYDFGGLHAYNTFVHVDSRPVQTRW